MPDWPSTSILIYDSANRCVRISNLNEDTNGMYKRHDDALYVHTDSTKNKILKFFPNWDNGWSGCTGSATFVDPKCAPGKAGRWAFIKDLSSPVVGNVNIWTKKGDSSGYIPCGRFKFDFCIGHHIN